MALLQTIKLPSRCARLRVWTLVRCLLQILHYSCRMPLDTVQSDFNRFFPLILPVDASIYLRQLDWFFLCVLSMKPSSLILTIISAGATTAVVALPVPVAQKTNLPGNWTYAGCLREPATGTMFHNRITWIGNNSAVACMNQCAAFGYPASGVEVSYKACCETFKILELTSFLTFSPLYLVWSRMLCVSDTSYSISHNSLNNN